MKYILSLVIFACIFQVSCSNSKKTIMLNPVSISASNKGMDIYRGSRPRIWDIIHTRVQLGFNYKEKTATGKAWINIHPYCYATDTLELDAKGMQITSVMLTDSISAKPLKYKYENDLLKIRFDKTYTTADSIQLLVTYKAMPYSQPTGGSAAITDDRGLYFINTDNSVPNKPVQIWTQGETESNSRWLPTIDAPNERFTTQLELTVPDSFVTLSNGSITGQLNTGNGLRTDIWRMEKPIQTYAIMFAIGNFEVIKDEWKRKEISYYVEPEFAPYARLMFRNTPEMVDYFSQITGIAYPWNKYSQVVVRDYVSGAMENTSATLFGEFMNQNARENADYDFEDIVSHELFHQWFGDYVTAESWSNITLNESFATYGEMLWRRYKYGNASADELGYNTLWAYLSQASTQSPPLVRYHYSDREEVFDRVSYQKGGMTLNYLHGLMGDAAFNKAMSIYLSQNALKPGEASQWRIAVEEATGQDWNWFFNQWYYRGGHPELDIKYAYDDNAQQLTVIVTQKQDSLYFLPLKSEIIYNGEKTVVDWNITARKQVYTYAYKNKVKPVVVPDSKHWLVGKITENKEPQQWLTIFANSNDNILNRHYALYNVRKKLDDSSARRLFNMGLNDKEFAIRKLTVEYLKAQKSKKVQDEWKSKIMYTLATDGSNKVRASALDVLAEWKVTEGKDEIYTALGDSSYNVASSALNAINEINKDTSYVIAKQMLNNNPKSGLLDEIWSIIGNKGNAEDAGIITKDAPYFYGNAKVSFIYSVSAYLGIVKDKKAFNDVLATSETLITNEGIKTYRAAMAASLFQTAADYKEKIKRVRTNAGKEEIQQKLDTMKLAFERIIKNEKETDNLDKYKVLMNAIYN